MKSRLICFVLVVLVSAEAAVAHQWQYASHGPPRPLPTASERPRGTGPARFVDGRRGNDAAAGTEAQPWKTVQHAVKQLKPGDTLYLRGGKYYEQVIVELQGTADQPITIRSYPEELATIDGGLREFYDSPATAWEEVNDAAKGEFRSTKSYPNLVIRPEATNVMGNFGDSLVPLQGYRFLGDLRSDNPFWNVDNKTGGESFVYCGPGLFFNPETNRIHCRLAHTQLAGLGKDNYRGESDPRKIPLVIAAGWEHSPLKLQGCKHLKLQDLVLRGSVETELDIFESAQIELSGVSLYGGNTTVRAIDTQGLRMVDCALRGIAAPWTFRGSLKYRAVEARLFSASRWSPTGNDSAHFELAHCEFTDSVDGIFLGNVRNTSFHHNLVENISDDGLFLTCGTAYDGTVWGGDIEITQNRFARILTTFAFGVGHGRQKVLGPDRKQTGQPAIIARNVFDFRQPVHYRWPNGPDDVQELNSYGRFAGDHGSPAWEPMLIVHNTILSGDPPRYDYLTDGLGRAMQHGTRRRVFNNIVCQMQGLVGSTLPPPTADFQADGNLAWSLTDGEKLTPLFDKFRKSPSFAASQEKYPVGWTTNDVVQPPRFVKYPADGHETADVRLTADSPAVNSGVVIRDEWSDPLKSADAGHPDRGAIPLGAAAWQIGVQGRWNVTGELIPAGKWLKVDAPRTAQLRELVEVELSNEPMKLKRALLVQGYPAFEAPLIEYALRKQGTKLTSVEKTWMPPDQFKNYDLVAYDGSLGRAKITPAAFSPEDVKVVDAYLRNGGVLLLMRDRLDLFSAQEGKLWLGENLKLVKNAKAAGYELLQPKHPWLAHLDAATEHAWLQAANNLPLSAEAGERIIGSGKTAAILYRQSIGKGALIYVGFSPAAALPGGRAKETVEREAEYEAQYRVLANILRDPFAK